MFALLTVALAGSGVRAGSVALTTVPCGVYAGTIGSSPIVAQFCVPVPTRGGAALAGSVSGEYYYRSVGVSISLNGSPQSDGSVHLDELVASDNAFGLVPSGDEWRLRRRDARIEGTWCKGCAGHPVKNALQLRLERIGDVSRSPDPSGDLYRAQVLAAPLSRSAPHAVSPAISYVTVSDERYGAATIELASFPTERTRLLANRALADDLRLQRLDAFDCLSNARSGWVGAGQWNERIHQVYVTARVVSLDQRATYNCAGPYPTNNQSRPITLDMRSGTEFALTKALVFDGERTLLRKYLHRVSKPLCNFSVETLSAQGFNFWLTRSGLAIRPNFPHVSAICNIIATIPYREVRPLFFPNDRDLLQ